MYSQTEGLFGHAICGCTTVGEYSVHVLTGILLSLGDQSGNF